MQTIQEIIQIDRLRVERLPTREGEQAAGQCCCPLGAPLGIGQRALKIQAVSQAAAVPLSGLKVAKHYHQEIIEVVRNPPAELAHGFKLLRSGQLLLNALKFILGLLSLCYVASYFCKPDQFASLICDAIDDN